MTGSSNLNCFSYVVICFLVSLYFVNVLSTDGETVLVYLLNATAYFNLSPKNSKVMLHFEGIVHARGSKHDDNAIAVKLADVNMTILGNNQYTDVKECEEADPIIKILERPFLMIFDSNGMLQKIKVTEGEPGLSVNVKLYFANMVQVNKTKLIGMKDPREIGKSNELNYYGNCDITYDVKKPSSGSKFNYIKTIDTNSCTAVNSTFDHSYLSEVCNPVYDNYRSAAGSWDVHVTVDPLNYVYFEQVEYIEYKFYKPFQNNSDKLIQFLLIDVTQLPILANGTIPEDTSVVDVTSPIYMNVNEKLFKNEIPTDKTDISAVYKSLACNPHNMNIFVSSLEVFLLCKA